MEILLVFSCRVCFTCGCISCFYSCSLTHINDKNGNDVEKRCAWLWVSLGIWQRRTSTCQILHSPSRGNGVYPGCGVTAICLVISWTSVLTILETVLERGFKLRCVALTWHPGAADHQPFIAPLTLYESRCYVDFQNHNSWNTITFLRCEIVSFAFFIRMFAVKWQIFDGKQTNLTKFNKFCKMATLKILTFKKFLF